MLPLIAHFAGLGNWDQSFLFGATADSDGLALFHFPIVLVGVTAFRCAVGGIVLPLPPIPLITRIALIGSVLAAHLPSAIIFFATMRADEIIGVHVVYSTHAGGYRG